MHPIHTTALTQTQKNDVQTLLRVCKDYEPLALSAPEEDGLDFFLFYDKEQSSSLLSFAFLFFPEKTTCECTIFVHPSYRKQGICTCMLNMILEYVEDLEKREQRQVDFCFLTDPKTPSALAVMEALEAEYWYSEYKMVRKLKKSDKAFLSSLSINEAEPGIYTASLNGQVIGSCAVLPSGEELYLYAFQIKDSFRGQGYGRDFLLGILALLSSDYKQISIQVSGQNYIARNLYKKTGFQTVESLSYYLY